MVVEPALPSSSNSFTLLIRAWVNTCIRESAGPSSTTSFDPVHKFWTVKFNEKYFQISEDDVTQISDIRISGYKPKLYILIGQQLESISFSLGMVAWCFQRTYFWLGL